MKVQPVAAILRTSTSTEKPRDEEQARNQQREQMKKVKRQIPALFKPPSK